MQLEKFEPGTDLPLDDGIRRAVLVLRSEGIETFESCEGGPGHAFPDPTIKFHGSSWAGYRALAVAMENGLRVARLQRVYHVHDGQLAGPWWELVFHTPVDPTCPAHPTAGSAHTTGDQQCRA
jgi:hypothetical protein